MTGDYWHTDFKTLIGDASFPITLQPFQNITSGINHGRDFDLVVIAQSRRGQYDAKVIERLVALLPNTPIVALCGSWCEGETRSGSPAPGVIRVYWHQWLGQMDNFLNQIRQDQLATWQMPKIAAVPDLIMHQLTNLVDNFDRTISVGVSTYTRESYLMLQDAVANHYKSTWIEGIDANDINGTHFSVICIEGNSLTTQCQQRIQTLQKQFPGIPMVLILNFPRHSEFKVAKKLGVAEIVSKPFQLCDLNFAINRLLPRKAA
jgi:hypothetical protein